MGFDLYGKNACLKKFSDRHLVWRRVFSNRSVSGLYNFSFYLRYK
ncbi:hypothetical protein HMPREF9370_0268 [Neisseria wadsworthii 9715]|uniref:Uncharacterized protein n=1 Tax=Neisseria wadsworthii 9715 TaxID=1030841 RepID=G4CMF9_9NEIS|nr:hypothetical protein HMPREF9370_0268 [Neisseria wadsworthii 9715]